MVSSAVPVYSLPRLMKKLARTYRLPNSEKLWGIDGYHVFPGMMCAVRDFNGVWNRGEILSNIRGRMYSVRCVDFGENLSVSVYQLRRLFPEVGSKCDCVLIVCYLKLSVHEISGHVQDRQPPC